MLNDKQIERTVNKVARLNAVYEPYIIESKVTLSCQLFETKEHYFAPPKFEQLRDISKGNVWGGENVYGWFLVDISKLERKNKEYYILSETDGIESLMYVDGQPYGMFDIVDGAMSAEERLHKYVPLDINAKSLCIESYSGHAIEGTMPYATTATFSLTRLKSEKTFKGIYAVTFNKEVKKFTENITLINSEYRASKNKSFYRAKLQNLYLSIFEIVDLMPNDGYNQEKIITANNLIEDYRRNKSNAVNLPSISLVGHSHLDTAWLWKVEETKHKFIRTIATAVRLLNKYPQYIFMTSSCLHMEWIKQYEPLLFEKVVKLYKEGRFEVNGATWIECDGNIPCGESFARQFIRGQRWMKDNFGKYADCFFLPDTFGYSGAIPQIMRQSKVKYFLTTKLRWNDTNKFPYDTFVWQGIDRSKVLTHFNTIQCIPNAETIYSRAEEISNKRVCSQALLSYGYGDGGGGAEETMIESALDSIHNIKDINCKHSTVSEFMQELSQTEGQLPIYKGELYLELHRGTLTTNHDIKETNRRLEKLLHNAEFLSVILNADTTLIKEEYDVLLQNQFHDILPGTAITEAMEEAVSENKNAIDKMEEYNAKLLTRPSARNAVSLVNTTSFPISGESVVDCDIDIASAVTQKYVDLQGNTKTAFVADIDGLSAKSYTLGATISAESPFIIKETRGKVTSVESALFVIMFDDAMRIVSLFDKRAQRNVARGKFNNITLGENVPYAWDDWDIDADYNIKSESVLQLISTEIISNGALQLRIRNAYKLSDKSTLWQDVVIHALTAQIDFENKLDWRDLHKILRADFCADIATDSIKCETQFGYIERSTKSNTSEEQAQFEFCNHKWSDMSESNYGVTFVNDCKYGVSCKDGLFGLTLATSGNHPDKNANAGVHYFKYGIFLHNEAFKANNAVKFGYLFNYQPLLARGKLDFNFVKVDKPNIVVETVKQSEDGKNIVIRLYESERSPTVATIIFDQEYKVYETDFIEDDKTEIFDGKEISLHFNAFEIKTLILEKK